MSSVVLVSIDGLRADAILKANCPHLNLIRTKGAATLKAQSVMPSITLPCHTSIFYSVPPERHGIITNERQPFVGPLPGLVELASQHNKRCAFLYNWENLRNLSQPGHLDYAFFINTAQVAPLQPKGDHAVAEEAARLLTTAKPDFTFIYLGTLDAFGHQFGWMSLEYLEQLERTDDALGLILKVLPDDTTILVQSDHGGHDRTHGTSSSEDMTIPWLIAGPDIKEGFTIQREVSLLDTAPTLAHIMGIPLAPQWEGQYIQEVFVTDRKYLVTQ